MTGSCARPEVRRRPPAAPPAQDGGANPSVLRASRCWTDERRAAPCRELTGGRAIGEEDHRSSANALCIIYCEEHVIPLHLEGIELPMSGDIFC